MIAEANRLGSLGDVWSKADLLLQAGYAGDGEAFYELARMYQDGQLPNDDTAMLGYLNQAQALGNTEATRVLGLLYLIGHAVTQDTRYGRMLLAQAAQTSSRAAREYGLFLTNQRQPYLNDPELGIAYLEQAADQGDADALRALSIARGTSTGEEFGFMAASDGGTGNIYSRSMRGDPAAVFDYGQQVLIQKVPADDPLFTGYCWIAVAAKMGLPEAANELNLIQGVRYGSDQSHPGRLDQCISDLHYQITGRD